ncbi:T9SS type A sorting domain-containing protein [uncultured Algibacter sp.]|uniref:T9SS type A sorting domain-containing protein n=1 Tax=uncultured Algibacter sp. TaxID=298659 RepID=UPI0032167F97
MKKLLKNSLLLIAVGIMATIQTHAQVADLEYTFDGATFEGFGSQGGTGAFVSVFANSNPGMALNVSWPNVGANTKNIILYGAPDLQNMNADDRKFFEIVVSNSSSEINVLRLRGRAVGGGFVNFIDIPITDSSGTPITYAFEVPNPAYAGQLDRFQIVFRNSSNTVVLTANANTDAILVDNIKVSANDTTLSTDSVTKNKLRVFVSNETLNVPEASKYQIYSVTGSVVKSGEETRSINVSDLSSGLYIYKTEKGFAKFVK